MGVRNLVFYCLFLGTRQEIGERNVPRECPWNPSAERIFEMRSENNAIKKQRADIPKGRSALWVGYGNLVTLNSTSSETKIYIFLKIFARIGISKRFHR